MYDIRTEEADIRFLVADDEEDFRQLLKTILTKKGYRVTEAVNGEEALDLIDREYFDIIITDLKMPGADGFAVLERSIEKNPDTQVILITGYASLESALKAIKEGAYDYVKKPFSVDEIDVIIRNAVLKINLIKANRNLLKCLKKAYERLSAKNPDGNFTSECTDIAVNERRSNKLPPELGSIVKWTTTKLLPCHYTDVKKRDLVDFKEVLEGLKLLARLKDDGFITENEFREFKRKF